MLTEVARNHVVMRLQQFREQLEKDMSPQDWTELEVAAHVLLYDVCKTLDLSNFDVMMVLGINASLLVSDTLETRVCSVPRLEVPFCERQVKALIFVQQEGMINLGTYRELCPHWSDETLRLDLVELAKAGYMVKHGECKGTFYTLAEDER